VRDIPDSCFLLTRRGGQMSDSRAGDLIAVSRKLRKLECEFRMKKREPVAMSNAAN